MPVVKIENLFKSYNFDHLSKKNSYVSLRDKITEIFTSPAGFFCSKRKNDLFWVLKDINLEIEKGEVLGIIGANGAGKSTLLKILSRITPPTKGRVVLKGSFASLLEVGTGFHPELTGRENIYLNSSILGMQKKEIDRKIENIVEFSGIKEFLDMPVKHYSSGMYVRLAFSVAAHTDPDILFIDEVLAVGDAEFQKKCIGKMNDISRSAGKTIIFVSHDMSAVQNLCNRCILLESGIIKKIGEPKDVISYYLDHSQNPEIRINERKDRTGNGKIKILDIKYSSNGERKNNTFLSGNPSEIIMEYSSQELISQDIITVYLSIDTIYGQRISTLCNSYTGELFTGLPREGKLICKFPILPLAKGEYIVSTTVKINNETVDNIYNASRFFVENGCFYKNNSFDLNKPGRGPVLINHNWSIKEK